jgi:hypothetical protein
MEVVEEWIGDFATGWARRGNRGGFRLWQFAVEKCEKTPIFRGYTMQS